jgi:hypothetical protein
MRAASTFLVWVDIASISIIRSYQHYDQKNKRNEVSRLVILAGHIDLDYNTNTPGCKPNPLCNYHPVPVCTPLVLTMLFCQPPGLNVRRLSRD